MTGRLAARIVAGAWGLAIVIALIAAAFGPAHWRDTMERDGPACPLRTTTGIDCPFCGMTRASFAMIHGDWGHAFELHPLAPLVLAGTLGLLGLVAFGRTEALLRGRRPFVLLGTILVIWIVRLVV